MVDVWNLAKQLGARGLGCSSLLVYQNVSQVLLPAELSSVSYYPNYIERCTRFGTSHIWVPGLLDSTISNRLSKYYTIQMVHYQYSFLHVHSTCFEYSVHIVWLYNIHGYINICIYSILSWTHLIHFFVSSSTSSNSRGRSSVFPCFAVANRRTTVFGDVMERWSGGECTLAPTAWEAGNRWNHKGRLAGSPHDLLENGIGIIGTC